MIAKHVVHVTESKNAQSSAVLVEATRYMNIQPVISVVKSEGKRMQQTQFPERKQDWKLT
jgi:hypothetical protein